MASHREFVEFITEQLREAGDVRARPMFGEYGLYCGGVFFAVICDDQLFVKPTPQGEAAFPRLPKEPPYRHPPLCPPPLQQAPLKPIYKKETCLEHAPDSSPFPL